MMQTPTTILTIPPLDPNVSLKNRRFSDCEKAEAVVIAEFMEAKFCLLDKTASGKR